MNLARVLLFPFVMSFCLGEVCRLLLGMCGVVDHPNARSSHQRPTVRGGGLSIMTALTAGVLVLPLTPLSAGVTALLGLAVFLAAVSFWDDVRSLPNWVRFGCQSLAAGFLLATLSTRGSLASLFPAGLWPWAQPLVWLLLFLWLVGYANAFNFMDGINGLAAGQAVVTGVGTAVLLRMVAGRWDDELVVVSLIVAGAAAGFLPHNFPKARMFMGDVGSVPLGFILAGLVLCAAGRFGPWIVVPLCLLHANFILDTGITLARRVLRGEKWHAAHREHFYQLLVRSGCSHLTATSNEIAIQSGVLLFTIIYPTATWMWRVILIGLVLFLWCGFFLRCQRLFDRKMKPVG